MLHLLYFQNTMTILGNKKNYCEIEDDNGFCHIYKIVFLRFVVYYFSSSTNDCKKSLDLGVAHK